MSNFDGRPPGHYWIRHSVPVSDQGGVLREEWSLPLVAELRDGKWLCIGSQTPLVLEVEILAPIPDVEGCRQALCRAEVGVIGAGCPVITPLPLLPLDAPLDQLRAAPRYRVTTAGAKSEVGQSCQFGTPIGTLLGVVQERTEDGFILGEPEWIC